MKEKANATLPTDFAAWHFLSRTTFGPRPQDVERAKQIGMAGLLDEQLHPEKIDDSEVERRIASLPTLTMSPAELMEEFPVPKQANNPQGKQQRVGAAPAMAPNQDGMAKQGPPEMNQGMEADGPRRIIMELAREQFWRAAYSQRQLQEVMVHFWMNHFNIYAAKGVDKWLLTSFEHDAIRPNALGSFSQLLAATAHFISLKLCRHFVADDPPDSVVGRAARTFTKSQGDIPSVLKTILTSPEFNSPSAFRTKVKSPFELVASSLRTLGAETDGGAPLMGLIMRMGQPLFQYQAPTGFPDRAGSWINSGTLLARMNFSMALAANRIRGTQLDLQALTPSDAPQAVWDHLVQRTLGGHVSRETQVAVMKSLENLDSMGGGNPRAFPKTTLMAALLLGSPDFQRR
jgi:uncharacterized protein (DUF1800 family)